MVGAIRSTRSYRWLVTFGFGLIHGIGLSYVLCRRWEWGMTSPERWSTSTPGVELGQLCILAACLPLTIWVFRQPWGLKAASAVSGVLAVAGMGWFVERVIG